MRKISNVGMRKFVKHAQNIQNSSSIGRKHLQLLFPAQLLSTVVLNISGIAGRVARTQQTRITRDHLRQIMLYWWKVGLYKDFSRKSDEEMASMTIQWKDSNCFRVRDCW